MAWDLLCERFDNKSMLVNNYLKSLFNIPNITKESSKDIRTLLNGINKNLRSLEALNDPVVSWDTIVIFFMTSKLDPVTAREWQEQKPKNELATLEEFKLFIKSKAELLETLEATSKESKSNKFQVKGLHSVVKQQFCPVCKNSHLIVNCESFLKLSEYERYDKARRLKLCLNCLRSNHMSKECSSSSCRKCSGRHHTLLHYSKRKTGDNISEFKDNTTGSSGQLPTGPNQDRVESLHVSTSLSNHCDVLLSTALVQVVNHSGDVMTCRALLDTGSQSNFISEATVRTLLHVIHTS